jgi:hypothetical protein
MSRKTLCLAALIGLASVALPANNASATVSTEAARFYVGTSEAGVTALPEGISGVRVATAKIGLGKALFETEISGLPVKLTYTGIECDSFCEFENKKVTEKTGAVAVGHGKLKFTGVSVVTPAGCTLSDENSTINQILTKSLVFHGDWMDTTTANKHAFFQFIPALGAGTTIAQFKLSGGECAAIEGAKNIAGSFFGEFKNNTGVAATSQEMVLSPAVQTTTGAALTVGAKAANLTGAISFRVPAHFGIELPLEFFSVKP